jgi:NDP-sugar pyrophosphorylase family protein
MARAAGLRALVLAAGRGERLRPLTAELPKPLLPVAGRPLVAVSLDALAAAGCEAIALNLHHRGAALRSALGESWRGVPLTWSEEPELLGTGGALVPLAGFFAGARAVAILNGDSYCRWPLDRLLALHRRRRAAVTLLVHRRAPVREFGGGLALEGERVVAFRSAALAAAGARTRRVFAGAAVLAPGLVERLPAGASDIVSALYEPLLAAGEPIVALETARRWHDLGTPARYLAGALDAALAPLPAGASRVAAGAEVAAGARLRGSMVESGARVGSRARLARSLVLGGAEVGEGAELEETIVGPGVRVPPGARARRRLLTVGEGPEPVETPLDPRPAAAGGRT